jgi:ankyrin repeat protein
MTTSLPSNPSFENLRKQAKTLRKACEQGDLLALQRIQAHLSTAMPRLADCQFVLAREFGFQSWRQLKTAVESTHHAPTGEFVTTACLCYDYPHYDHRSFHARAHQMLQQNPWLAEAYIWSAATVGNTAAVRAFLNANPQQANQPGPNGWPPLLCACYSRVQPIESEHSTFQVAKVLLARGADPNAFTMKGERRFTLLTGLFGGGSTGMANQSPHPRWRDLAELLLEHGANPADEEALRINQDLAGTYGKLEILLRHGLPPSATGAALSRAVLAADAESVKHLHAHHAPTDEPFNGKLPWRHAIDSGHLDLARLLVEAGAPQSELDEVERFVSLCMAGEKMEVSPRVLARAPKQLVLMASNGGRTAAVELALDLGFDPNYLDEVTALHNAAARDNEEIVRLLLQHGASLTIRDPDYDGTPVGWADFFDRRPMRDMLLSQGAICLFDALDFNRLDRIPDILQRDPAALNRTFADCITREPRPEDRQTPLARMVDRGNVEAARILRECGAQ